MTSNATCALHCNNWNLRNRFEIDILIFLLFCVQFSRLLDTDTEVGRKVIRLIFYLLNKKGKIKLKKLNRNLTDTI